MQGNNTMTVETYLESLTHPRRRELAGHLLESETPEQGAEKALANHFAKSVIAEEWKQITQNVKGYENTVLNLKEQPKAEVAEDRGAVDEGQDPAAAQGEAAQGEGQDGASPEAPAPEAPAPEAPAPEAPAPEAPAPEAPKTDQPATPPAQPQG